MASLFCTPPGVLILSSRYFFPKSSWKTLFLKIISFLIAWVISSTIVLSFCFADTNTPVQITVSPFGCGEAFPRQCCLRSWHCLHSQLSLSRNLKTKQFLMLAQSVIYPHGTPVPIVFWLILRLHDIAQFYYLSNTSHEGLAKFARMCICEIYWVFSNIYTVAVRPPTGNTVLLAQIF